MGFVVRMEGSPINPCNSEINFYFFLEELKILSHFKQEKKDELKLLQSSETCLIFGARNTLFHLRPDDLTVLSISKQKK